MSEQPTEIQPAPKAARTPITVSSYPKARRSVQRIRHRSGFFAFVLTLLFSLHAGVPAFDATARALLAGILVHLAAWMIAVTVWRQLIVAELNAVYERRRERMRAREERAAAATG